PAPLDCAAQGLTDCFGQCADITTSGAHCGGCGLFCPTGEECRASLCVPVGGGGCKTGFTPCGTTCADLQSDANNCGACGVGCSDGTTCQGGSCIGTTEAPAPLDCAAQGLTDCFGQCADITTSGAH